MMIRITTKISVNISACYKDKEKDLFIGQQEFLVGYSKAPEQAQSSSRLMSFSRYDEHGEQTSHHTHCCIGARSATHCATGDECHLIIVAKNLQYLILHQCLPVHSDCKIATYYLGQKYCCSEVSPLNTFMRDKMLFNASSLPLCKTPSCSITMSGSVISSTQIRKSFLPSCLLKSKLTPLRILN